MNGAAHPTAQHGTDNPQRQPLEGRLYERMIERPRVKRARMGAVGD